MPDHTSIRSIKKKKRQLKGKKMAFKQQNLSDSDSLKTLKEETEESDQENPLEYEPTEEEAESLCRAFTLLDVDGDGVIDPSELSKLLLSWGRLPFNDELADILSYANGRGCEGETGMNFEGFKRYITKQLVNTRDEDELRDAFQAFDTSPPTGKANLRDLRHYLKRKGIKLTDDEIDFLYKEENYWMLEEKYMFAYENLINKILDRPLPNDPFLYY